MEMPVTSHMTRAMRDRRVEPQQAGFEQLLAKEPHTTILPYAIGDGTEQPFYRCFAPGMSSTLKPDIQWLHFMLGFEQWSEVVQTTTVNTNSWVTR